LKIGQKSGGDCMERRQAMFIKHMAIVALCQVCVAGVGAMPTRYEQLEKAINGGTSIRIRAINEIGGNILNKEYQKLLVKYLFSDDWGDFGESALIRAFSKADPSIAAQVIECYKNSQCNNPGKEDLNFIKVCTVLEKIGGPAELVQQFYLEESKRTPLSQLKEAWLRICFLSQGIERGKNLKQLKADLQNSNSPLARKELYPMSIIGCQEYADRELIAILTRNVGHSDAEISGLSALALSSVKTITSQELSILEENTKKSTNPDDYTDDYNSSLVKNMCVAALDKKQSEERVKIVLHNTGCEEGYFNHSIPFIIMLACDLLVDKPMREIIEKSLSDSDPNIVRGALIYIYCLGFECKSTEPEIFRLLENSNDEETRRLAACTLAVITRQDQIPRLEKILKNEKSENVQRKIRYVIQVLNMNLSYSDKDTEGD
jgi:hypothetical protein